MQLMTVRDVAKRLCHSPQTVRNLIARGLLKCYRCPGVRISEEHLEAYLSQVQQPRSTRVRQPRPATRSIRHLNADRLRDAWKQQGVD